MHREPHYPALVSPTIEVRLARQDLLLVRPLLSRLWYSTRSTGESPFPAPPISFDYLEKSEVAVPTQVWAAHIEKLSKALFTSESPRPRLELDFLDLSLCQLAVRGLPKQIKNNGASPPRLDYLSASQRFLRRLERIRKRAKNAAVQKVGALKYDMISSKWRQYESDLRKCCVNCTLRHTSIYARVNGSNPAGAGIQSVRPLFIAEIVKIAERELVEEGLPVPSATLLRQWATLLLQYVRRGREGELGSWSLTRTPAGITCIRRYMRKKVCEHFGEGVCQK